MVAQHQNKSQNTGIRRASIIVLLTQRPDTQKQRPASTGSFNSGSNGLNLILDEFLPGSPAVCGVLAISHRLTTSLNTQQSSGLPYLVINSRTNEPYMEEVVR